jgi:drug/metabolite transporter (DMT)-like permease
MKDDSIRKGLFFMLVASFCFALTGAFARILRDDISNVEMVLFRNLIGVVFIGYSLLRRPAQDEGGKPGLLIFRGIIGTLALYAFFYGISRIGLAVAITYQQSYPVFLSLAAAWMFGDKLKVREWVAILLGFGGVALIFLPQINVSEYSLKYNLIGLSNAVMTGMAYLSIRGLSQYYDNRKIVLSFMLSGIILPLISLSLGAFIQSEKWDFIIASFEWPATRSWGYILLLGISALIGQVYLTKAFAYQKTGIIGAVGYSNIVFSVGFGVLLGDQIPGWEGMMGILLVLICGIMISIKS